MSDNQSDLRHSLHGADAVPDAPEDRYRQMFDQCPLGMAVTDAAYRFTYVNPAFCAMFGYSVAELAFRTFRDLTHPDDVSRDIESVRKLVAGEIDSYTAEKKYLTRCGEVFSGCVTVKMVRTPQGKPRECLVIVENISGRKLMEETLRKSEENYRLLVDNLNAGVFETTLDGRLIRVNRAALEICGFDSVDDLMAQHLQNMFCNPSDREAIVCRLMKAGEVRNEELLLKKRDGTRIWVAMNAVLRKDADRVLGIINDISERKKAEDMLLNVQKLDSLGVLAGGIAHDFNNMLMGFFGNVDLARMVSADERVNGYLDLALGSLSRTKALTMQLLTFSRGGDPVRKISALQPLIRETVGFALSGSNTRGVYLFEDDLRHCFIDTHQIRQVIENIVINAQQAMPGGGVVEIKAANVAVGERERPPLDAGEYVRVSIGDTGIGIPQEIMSRIFDPFFTTKIKGHGLGLATAYSIMRRHGGYIHAESEPGRGSTFHLYLPASRGTASPGKPSSHLIKGSGTIVVVDDEDTIRKALQQMLTILGYTVELRNDGKGVVDWYCEAKQAGRPVAGMIFDLTIPGGMGGRETIAELRNVDPDLPVIVASGYADDSIMKNPSRYGFTGSIPKPFTIAELSGALAAALERRGKAVA